MVSLVQLSDIHLLADPKKKLHGFNTQDTLEKVLAKVKQYAPNLVVMTGDLTQDGDLSAYHRLAKSVATLNCPVYWVPGNHDDIDNAQAGLVGANLRHDQSLVTGNWHLIFLDTTAPGLDDGFLSTLDFEQLQHSLHSYPQTPTLIFMHHPPIAIGCYMDEIRLVNEEPFLSILHNQPQIRAICFGHVHQVFETKQQNLYFLSAPSTAMQFAPKLAQFGLDKSTGPGFRWLELNADGGFATGIERV